MYYVVIVVKKWNEMLGKGVKCGMNGGNVD